MINSTRSIQEREKAELDK